MDRIVTENGSAIDIKMANIIYNNGCTIHISSANLSQMIHSFLYEEGELVMNNNVLEQRLYFHNDFLYYVATYVNSGRPMSHNLVIRTAPQVKQLVAELEHILDQCPDLCLIKGSSD